MTPLKGDDLRRDGMMWDERGQGSRRWCLFDCRKSKVWVATLKDLPTDLMIEICRAMVAALDASMHKDSDTKLTNRQAQIAIRAGIFVAACAKVGLDALVDEATGNQYERAEDALQVKLRAYLAEEMRKWEKTFPDDLWKEFGRLTGWKG